MSEEEVSERDIPFIGTYEGERNEFGERHGKGVATHPNDDMYKGEYKGGYRNGKGIYLWAYRGMKYEGEYVDGWREGNGKMKYTNGTIYEGQWHLGRREGQGKMVFPNGDVYEGDWEKGLPHGQGKYSYARHGFVLDGKWEFGRIVYGELIYSDALKWVGEFKYNQPFGKGMFVSKGVEQKGTIIDVDVAANPENASQLDEEDEESTEPEEEEENEEDQEEDDDEEPDVLKKPPKRRFPKDIPRLPKIRDLRTRFVPETISVFKE